MRFPGHVGAQLSSRMRRLAPVGRSTTLPDIHTAFRGWSPGLQRLTTHLPKEDLSLCVPAGKPLSPSGWVAAWVRQWVSQTVAGGWVGEWVGGWLGGWMCSQVRQWVSQTVVGGGVGACVVWWLSIWVGECVAGWVNAWVGGWVGECVQVRQWARQRLGQWLLPSIMTEKAARNAAITRMATVWRWLWLMMMMTTTKPCRAQISAHCAAAAAATATTTTTIIKQTKIIISWVPWPSPLPALWVSTLVRVSLERARLQVELSALTGC